MTVMHVRIGRISNWKCDARHTSQDLDHCWRVVVIIDSRGSMPCRQMMYGRLADKQMRELKLACYLP